MTRRGVLVGLAVLVIVGAVVAACLTVLVWKATPIVKTMPTASPAPAGLDRYYHQSLEWQRCARAQCTWVTVPVDYADPDGKTLTLWVTLVPATGEARGSLFVNPGGPGGAAGDFAVRMAGEFGAGVTAMYDVIGVDPRGVGRSSALQCMSDRDFDAFIDVDPSPDSAAEVSRLRAESAALGQACLSAGGALARHVSTAEAARDMDVVRALLGRPKLDWYGASYGTLLGATYATLFPGRVGRMVLDGAVDPGQDAFESTMAQTIGFQRALTAYLDHCIAGGQCPLGNSRAAAESRLQALFAQLDGSPMRVGDRKLTEGRAFYGLALPLYDRAGWALLDDALKGVVAGDGAALLRISDLYFDRGGDGHFQTNAGEVFYAIGCLDATDRPGESAVRARLPEFVAASAVFGRTLGWAAMGCTDWPIAASGVPAIHAPGAPPILVLGTTRDPATPYESAIALAMALGSGVLVSRDGDGHTAYVSGNACITGTVDAFFTSGTVPATDPHC